MFPSAARANQFVANNPGDWAMHCHMSHHVMNQMGHGLPNLIGVDTKGLDQRARKAVPGYMTMGEAGMAEMGEMGMKVPRNSLPMVGGRGPHDYITMGGMYTNIKVRDHLESYDKDPGCAKISPRHARGNRQLRGNAARPRLHSRHHSRRGK